MFFLSQLANVAYFQTQSIQKSLLNAKKLENTSQWKNPLWHYQNCFFLFFKLNDFKVRKHPSNSVLTNSQITANNTKVISEMSWALRDAAAAVTGRCLSLSCVRSSLILRKTFKFTAASLCGRTLPAPRGLHCTNVRDKGIGKHTWSSSTWHLLSAVVGLLNTLFLKSFGL